MLQDTKLVDEWMNGINDPNFVPSDELYSDVVKRQHLE